MSYFITDSFIAVLYVTDSGAVSKMFCRQIAH